MSGPFMRFNEPRGNEVWVNRDAVTVVRNGSGGPSQSIARLWLTDDSAVDVKVHRLPGQEGMSPAEIAARDLNR